MYTTAKVPPIRSLPEAMREIREKDPHTSITLRALRTWVADGTLPSIKIGVKTLIDMNVLLDFLSMMEYNHSDDIRT